MSISAEYQAAIAKSIASNRTAFEVMKRLLSDCPPDCRAAVAGDVLPLYAEMAGLYNEMVAYLRALQVGAAGAA